MQHNKSKGSKRANILNLFAVVLVFSAGSFILFSLLQIARQARLQFRFPVLYWDSWTFVLRSDNNFWEWIFSQHNEHRIAWSRLATILETDLFGLPPTSTSIVQVLILSLINLLLLFLVCRSFLGLTLKALIVWLACALVLLNPWQLSNFYWEFQTPWIFTNTLVLTSVLAYYHVLSGIAGRCRSLSIVLLIFLPWIAIYNSGQGFALTAAILIIGWFISVRFFGCILLSSVGACALYFVGLAYNKPSHHPSISFDLEFFFQMLSGGEWRAMGALIVLFAILILLSNSVSKITYLNAKHGMYLALPGLFALVFSAMTTLSRSGLGPQQANAQHYVSHTLMLLLSLILILSYILEAGLAISIDRGDKSLGCYVIILMLIMLAMVRGNYISRWSNGPSSYWHNYSIMKCTMDKVDEDNAPRHGVKDCGKFELWPDESVKLDYFRGKLNLKPLGWHSSL